MKAIEVTEFGDSDVLAVTDTETPKPGSGEVRIEVEAAGVNFADIMQRRGDYRGGPEPPYVPGMEVAGTVDEAGGDVEREPGDRVVSMVNTGGYAEYAVADARGLLDVPSGMGFEEAAGFPVQFLTAHNCLHEWGDLAADESVLIHAAAGGVGTAAVQLAREAGAEVFGTASTAEKLETAAALGCDHPINYETEDFVAVVEAETDDGVDLVLDGVGGETSERSVDALTEFGRMVSYGAASGQPGRPPTDKLLFGNKQVRGYHLGRALRRQPARVMGAIPELTDLLEAGVLEVQVGESFPLDAAAAAHDHIEDRQSTGKVVLVP